MHLWLYHFLGGSEVDSLWYPPALSGRAANESVQLRTRIERTIVAEYKRAMSKTKEERKHLALNVRDAVVDHSILFRPVQRSIVVAAGGGGSEPPNSSDVLVSQGSEADGQLVQAFAMGTHPILGEGYASRDGPCAVRQLADHSDVLGLIADFVRDKPRRTLSPPPREVVILRARLVDVDRERLQWRHLADERQLLLEAAVLEAKRWARPAESARAEAHKVVSEQGEKSKELQRKLEEKCKQERRKWATTARENERWLTERWMSELEKRINCEAENVSKLEMMSGDRREDLQRLAAELDAAQQAAAEFERQYEEQLASVERLRCARNGSALERQAVLEAELKEAKRRRTLNQRRQSDANLAERRWRVAQEQLVSLREQFYADFMIDDEAQRQQAERADMLDKVVAGLEQSLKEQRELVLKYKSLAEPPTSKFFANRHYTSEVDITSLQLIANLGVSPNIVPCLFLIFAKFFQVQIPSRKVHVLVRIEPGGKRIYEEKNVPYTFPVSLT